MGRQVRGRKRSTGGDFIITGTVRLSDCGWFTGIYRDIYDILNIGGRLPPPSEIKVVSRAEGTVPENVLGFAVVDEGLVWFRHIPPDPVDFAHELIHLARKKTPNDPRLRRVYEEVYSYNIAPLVVLLAERGIKPRRNPLTLLEDVTMSDLLNAVNEVYGHMFSSIEEYFTWQGIMPTWMVSREPISEEDKLIDTVGELAAGAEYDPMMLRVILKLLNR